MHKVAIQRYLLRTGYVRWCQSARLIVCATLGVLLVGCAQTPVTPSASRSKTPVASDEITGWQEAGLASWYGPGFQGKRTASGERFDANALTAAHRTLPFGTRVRVKSLVNGKEVVVRINDRGPFIQGRIIDLSQAAALALDLSGVKRVELQQLR
jgi:rare lipoprotein A